MFFKLVPLLLLLSCLFISCVTSIPVKLKTSSVQPQTGDPPLQINTNLPSSNTNLSPSNAGPVRDSDLLNMFKPYPDGRDLSKYDIILRGVNTIYFIADLLEDLERDFVFIQINPIQLQQSGDFPLPGVFSEYSADVASSFAYSSKKMKTADWKLMEKDTAEQVVQFLKDQYAKVPLKVLTSHGKVASVLKAKYAEARLKMTSPHGNANTMPSLLSGASLPRKRKGYVPLPG